MKLPSHRRAGLRAVCVAALLALTGWLGCSLNTHGDAEDPAGGSPDASAGAAGTKADGGGGAFGGSGGTPGKGGTSGKGGTGGAAGSATGGVAGSATGGVAGSATGGAGGNGGTGGSVGPELCTNGADDNADGLIDCADPQCTPDHTCVPEPALGWGPITFLGKHAPNEPATDCGTLTATITALHHGVDIPTDGCACACSAPTGGMCTGGAGLWQLGSCSGGFAQPPTGCFDFHTSGWTIGGVKTTTVQLTTAGACAPSLSGAPQAASWVATIDRCSVGSTGAGCGIGQVCVPKPPGSLGAQACLDRSGIVACPAGYPQQQILYETMEDTRTCTATGCSCSAASGQSCDFSLALYTDAGCSTTPAGTYPLDGACHATGFPQGYIGSSAFTGSIKGGACTPSGGPSISGDVTPTSPHSVCCAP